MGKRRNKYNIDFKNNDQKYVEIIIKCINSEYGKDLKYVNNYLDLQKELIKIYDKLENNAVTAG